MRGRTIEEEYELRLKGGTDISAHMEVLRRLARETENGTVVEFGTRYGNSTCAFMMGLKERGGGDVTSYDIMENRACLPVPDMVCWEFSKADTSKIELPYCDLLFIDSWHSAEQVRAELRHESRVRQYLVFHDTVLFGRQDQRNPNGPGILEPIEELLAKGDWEVSENYEDDNGLMVLRRVSR